MAEYKQYVTQPQDNGAVLISEEVLSTVAVEAVGEVEGVAGLVGKPGADIADMIGKKNWGKGLKVTIGEGDEVYIDCNLTVVYGQSVVKVSKDVQASVAAALESMTGVTVANVNVNVCGIVRQ